MPREIAITNPFKERAMIPIESDMFFGREKEMQRIEEMLSGDRPQCVSIVGERRIGKSSLANRVFHKIKNDENTRAVYIDCDGIDGDCQTKDRFFQVLNQAFFDEAKEKQEGNLFDNYSSFKAFVKKEGGNGVKTIIFIDEFEHLPDNPFADDTFFSNLRALANNPDNRLAFVSVSKTALKELTHQAVKSSGFWNIFEHVYLGLMEHESIVKLRRYGFEKTGFALTKEEEEKIHFYAGDYPYFNQVACG
ncbi:MAG TPA: ATP-binding protein, partial [Candidatus Kapabacteria bacterium]|nr:ATP-binding protein [Candidatus Kapabacteria bacterium]